MRFWSTFAAIACFAIFVGRVNADDNKKEFSDARFVDKASMDGQAEIAAGKIAMTRAQNEQVKKFGARMVEDHTKANNELTTIVSEIKVPVPEKLSAEHEKMLMHFQNDSAADFDKDYMDHMVKAHEKAVELFTKASKECKNEKLKAFAEKTLPTLKQHLALARKIDGQLN